MTGLLAPKRTGRKKPTMATDSVTLKPGDTGFVGDQSSIAANTRGQVGDQSDYANQTRNTTKNDFSFSNNGDNDYSLTGGGLDTTIGMGDVTEKYGPGGEPPPNITPTINFTDDQKNQITQDEATPWSKYNHGDNWKTNLGNEYAINAQINNDNAFDINKFKLAAQGSRKFNQQQLNDIENIWNARRNAMYAAGRRGATGEELGKLNQYYQNQLRNNYQFGYDFGGPQTFNDTVANVPGGNTVTEDTGTTDAGIIDLDTEGYTGGDGGINTNTPQGNGLLGGGNPVAQNIGPTNVLTDEGKYGVYMPSIEKNWTFNGQELDRSKLNGVLNELRQAVVFGKDKMFGTPENRDYRQMQNWQRLAGIMDQNKDWEERIYNDIGLKALSQLSGVKPMSKADLQYIRWYQQQNPDWQDQVARFKEAYQQQLNKAKESGQRNQIFNSDGIL